MNSIAIKNNTIIMIILAIIYSVWLFWRAFLPLEIDSNEGWNAFHVLKTTNTLSFYPHKELLVINNYTPLSFILLGGIFKFTGFDIIITGRIVSLLSIFIITFLIYKISLLYNTSKIVAIFASAWFIATMSRFFWGYIGMNDPSILSLMIMLLGFYIFIKYFHENKPLYFALTIMVVAGFFKHNHIVFPFTALIMILMKDWRLGLKYTFYGASLCMVGLLICYIVYGDVFFHNLLLPRVVELRLTLVNIGRLQWILPALIIVITWLVVDFKSKSAKDISLLLCIAFISNLLQKMGEGVGNNAQFELVIATALGLALTIENISKTSFAKRFGQKNAFLLVMIILSVRLLASSRNEPYLFFFSQNFHQEVSIKSKLAQMEIERVKAFEGNVSCSIKSICFYAGKEFLLDGFYVYQLVRTGKNTQQFIDNYIKNKEIEQVYINEEARWLIH